VFVGLPFLNYYITNRSGGWNINMTMMPQPDLAKEPGPNPEGLVTMGKTSQRLDIPLLTLATAVVTLVMFLFGLLGSGGHLAAPLDDTFIHLQYARQLAAGHPFEYNTGDMPSSGASSFLYPFILAPAFLLGIDGTSAILYAIALGFFGHLTSILLLYKLAYHLFNRPVALLSASLLLLDGRTNWHALTGMETILYMGALVAFFHSWAKGISNNRFISIALIGSLTALLRVEGHIIASVICAVGMVYLWRSRGFARQLIYLTFPFLIGLIPYITNFVLTGRWQFNTTMSKSSFFMPYLPLFEQIWLVPAHFLEMVRDVYLGLNVPFSSFPLLITVPLAAIGIMLALADRTHKVLNTMLLFGLILGSSLALIPRGTHFDRYFTPYDFVVWLYFAAGVVWLAELLYRLLPAEVSRKAAYAGVTGTVVLFLLPQFLRYFFLFGESTRDIYYQQVVFSEWIRENTPVDARIAVNDVGAHKYLGDRYITDLVGLTDNELPGVFFSGWGSIYDVLTTWPEDKRPQYVLVHPDVYFLINNIGDSVAQGFLTPQYSIAVQEIVITAAPIETLYKINWERASLDQSRTYLLHTGEAYLDAINVGYLPDEKFHRYRTEGKQASIPEPKSFLTTGEYASASAGLSESGRKHSGWEQFTVRSIPGRPLMLVTRTLLSPGATQRLKVLVNEREVGFWEVHNDRGGLWQEYEYAIPAEFITADRTTIRIDAEFDPGGPGFTSYRYWIYAP
jgi:hypothetical protein